MVTAQKTKQKNADGELVNFAEQPLEIDSRAISHWSNPGEWVFVDGFGSGTSIVAAMREGRSCVATEPDPVQFEAAVARVSAAINQALMADLAAYKQQRRQERLQQAAVNLDQQKEKLAARQKKEEERKRKKAASTVSLHSFLIVFFRSYQPLGPWWMCLLSNLMLPKTRTLSFSHLLYVVKRLMMTTPGSLRLKFLEGTALLFLSSLICF